MGLRFRVGAREAHDTEFGFIQWQKGVYPNWRKTYEKTSNKLNTIIQYRCMKYDIYHEQDILWDVMIPGYITLVLQKCYQASLGELDNTFGTSVINLVSYDTE